MIIKTYINFGAARLLKENESYDAISLHGTFEYLHPDMFSKLYEAGLEVNPPDTFIAAYELWSIGATLYQAATGKLPFSPKRGRDAYKTMYEMISQKLITHISAKELKDGTIKWLEHLPKSAFKNSDKGNIEAYLAGLLNVCFEKIILK